uniref:Uncharacterized protein n=1 Tax=Monopterus albus TaxID=43700 RepID=A0A3Q3KSK0_MONAL
MLCALELLVMHRETCGVLKDNSHMFARPRAMTHFRGSECLRGVAKACGAKCPKSLTSTKLRKHAATISAVLNMTDAEMEQVANFLGHDIRIHGELYQLPEKTLRLAKLSKVLMALERGRFAEFHGKNLDEITVDPDKVLVCDEEDGSRKEGHRPTQRRTPWQQAEVQAVERHMSHFITSCVVPAKSDCEKCLQAEPEALKNRDWQNVKFFVYNRITAYKRK